MVVGSPPRSRTTGRRSLSLTISVVPLGRSGLMALLNHAGGPGIRGRSHASKAIQYRLIGASYRMVVAPVQLWTAPRVRLQSAY
jgi:hypothetical protein